MPKILGLKSRTDGVSVKVVGELNRPPYEKSNAGAALVRARQDARARESASIWWIRQPAAAPTAISPRRITATLDGLGVDGKGAHTHYEQMYISSIEPRARLLHRLYQTLR